MVKKFKAHNSQLTSFAFHPTKPYLLSASYDRTIKLLDWGSGWNKEPKLRFEEHKDSVTKVVFNPEDAKDYASASRDGTLKIWNVDSTVAYFTSPKGKSQMRCLDYFRRGDGQYLITGLEDGTAQIWNLKNKELVETLKGHTAKINAVCPHPDLPILLTGSADGTVRLWNSNSFR
ncbi:hypothetical protein HU200_029348 [Digitaria exilis]|uniref:Uncharacterized protein n=1 Tax=Digitaria exilis TaxID=1010633 RepID=A0A835BZ30_9POAL|nr:hypothetical protein HU200_029348 [Digitaria exilis]